MRTLVNRTVLVAGILVLCVAFAGAQNGQGGNGGGGRGQGRGGFGQRGGGGAGSELTLALRKDVQADLVVTDDQKTKLTDLQAKQREARRGQGGGNRGAGGNGGGAGAGGGTVDREALQKRMEEQRTQTHKDLAAILNEGQMKRLGEISIQLRGNRALTDADVQKALGLSDDQKTKIKDLNDKQREANTAIFEKVRNQEISQDDARKSMENNTKALDTELAKVLTADQATKLKDMGGKPFKADPAEAAGQGRRGGGGGGGR